MAAAASSPRSFREEEVVVYNDTVVARDQQSKIRQKKRCLKHFSFNYEPSKVETQLKESIQRLNTPADEKEPGISLSNESTAPASYLHDVGVLLTSLESSIGNKQQSEEVCSDETEEDCWEIPFQDIRDLEFVGSGGQGTVFKGVHRGRMVAVKKVNDIKQTKIHHLRKLHHENIIKFLGVCTSEPCYCVVMEYCSGGNVYQYIRRPNILMLPKKVFNWARQIANGMNYLHSQRIIHRDLKSLNVLVQKDKTLKITDFGTSRVMENQSSTVMTVVGSCAWMAPELIRNEPCSGRVDVWSYGILLWELLTQEVPYKGLNHGAIMFGVGSNRLSLPVPDKCPTELKDLLIQCWQAKSKDRPSFRQILDQLDTVRQGQFLTYSTHEYLTMRDNWRKEIDTHFDSLELSLESRLTEDYQLVIQRKEELKHAQEVREMYERKLETAERLCDELDHSKRLIDQRQHELDRWERELNEKLETYRSLCGSNSSSDEDTTATYRPGRSGCRIRRRRSEKRSTSRSHKDSNSTPDVFDSPVTSSPILGHPLMTVGGGSCTMSSSESKPRSYSSPICAKPRSDSIITDEGDVAPSVKKLINSVDATSRRPHPLQPGHNHQMAYLPRPSYMKHRRVKSCSSSGVKRRGSLNINRRTTNRNHYSCDNYSSHDHLSHDHLSHDNLSSDNHLSTGSSRKPKKSLKIVRSHSATSKGSPDTSVWNTNGDDGDTESNGEEWDQDDEDMGDEPLSSVPTSPMGPPPLSSKQNTTIVLTPPTSKGLSGKKVQQVVMYFRKYLTGEISES